MPVRCEIYDCAGVIPNHSATQEGGMELHPFVRLQGSSLKPRMGQQGVQHPSNTGVTMLQRV
jgi:hypothetical protein